MKGIATGGRGSEGEREGGRGPLAAYLPIVNIFAKSYTRVRATSHSDSERGEKEEGADTHKTSTKLPALGEC